MHNKKMRDFLLFLYIFMRNFSMECYIFMRDFGMECYIFMRNLSDEGFCYSEHFRKNVTIIRDLDTSFFFYIPYLCTRNQINENLKEITF